MILSKGCVVGEILPFPIPHPRGHLATSGDIFNLYNLRRAPGIWWVGAGGASQHPPGLGQPTRQRMMGNDRPISPGVEKALVRRKWEPREKARPPRELWGIRPQYPLRGSNCSESHGINQRGVRLRRATQLPWRSFEVLKIINHVILVIFWVYFPFYHEITNPICLYFPSGKKL